MADTPNDDKEPNDEGESRKSAYQLPDEADAEVDAEVIDLDAARPAAAGASIFDGLLGDKLRHSLRKFVIENVVPEGQKEGNVDLDIDVDFLKTHGASLLTHLADGVAKAILPGNVEVNVPIGKADPKAAEAADDSADAAPAEKAAAEVSVSVNFDPLHFLKSLITAAPSTPPLAVVPDPEDEPVVDEDSDDDELLD